MNILLQVKGVEMKKKTIYEGMQQWRKKTDWPQAHSKVMEYGLIYVIKSSRSIGKELKRSKNFHAIAMLLGLIYVLCL